MVHSDPAVMVTAESHIECGDVQRDELAVPFMWLELIWMARDSWANVFTLLIRAKGVFIDNISSLPTHGRVLHTRAGAMLLCFLLRGGRDPGRALMRTFGKERRRQQF